MCQPGTAVNLSLVSIHERRGETVWKFRRGPKQELRGRREGAKGAIYVPLPLQRLTIQTPQAIFQTVSPRTRVNKGKNKDRALERVSPSRHSVESARSPMHRERRKQWRKRGRHPSTGLPMFLGGCPAPTNPVPCPTAITRRPATLLGTGYSPCQRRCRSWISRRRSPTAAAATLQSSRPN